MLSAVLITNTFPNMGILRVLSATVQGGVSENYGFGGTSLGYFKISDLQLADFIDFRTLIIFIMKMQDAEKTWELIRGQAGQSTVLRTSGFSVNERIGDDYRDSMNTAIEQEDRVHLRDLQEQIEGEAHFVFSGQIVRGDMFYANPSLKKAQLRVPQLLQMAQAA